MKFDLPVKQELNRLQNPDVLDIVVETRNILLIELGHYQREHCEKSARLFSRCDPSAVLELVQETQLLVTPKEG